MSLSREDELADIFGDALRLAGSADAGKFFYVL